MQRSLCLASSAYLLRNECAIMNTVISGLRTDMIADKQTLSQADNVPVLEVR